MIETGPWKLPRPGALGLRPRRRLVVAVLVVIVALRMILWAINFFLVVVFPVVIALFIAALTAPLVYVMERFDCHARSRPWSS